MKHRTITLLGLFFLMTSAVVAQKAGQIVFSKSPIDASSPANLTSQFQAGDPIYGLAFFDKNIDQLSRDKTKVTMEVFVYELKAPLYDYQQPSEAQLDFGSMTVSGNAVTKSNLPVDIVPSPNSMSAYANPDYAYKKFGPKFAGPVKFAEALAKLGAGEHTIVVKVKCNYAVVAEGKFTIKGNDYAAYAAMSEKINAAASDIKTRGVMMPQSKRSDKKLVAEMTKAFKASNTYKDRVQGKIMRVVIIDPDWMVRRHKITGVILHRYIRAAIAVKNSDGTCTLWNLVTFQQDYVGNKFQATKFDGIGDPVAIPCGNVGK